MNMHSGLASLGFPAASSELDSFGLKFTPGGAHISRTIMLAELDRVLTVVPPGSTTIDYHEAIVVQNLLSKSTDSTRQKTLRHLRELYALDETMPIFGLLRKLHSIDSKSLPLLALQVAWARDPLLRATSQTILDTPIGDQIETVSLSLAIQSAFPDQYSNLSRNRVARNAASSWTQSGHLVGRANKTRSRVNATKVTTTMALFLGYIAGYYGIACFSNPWCRLLDLDFEHAKAMGIEAHRAALLNLRVIGDVVELDFPLLAEFQGMRV